MVENQNYVLPEMYTFTPLRALREASRQQLSGFLDLEGVFVVVNNEGVESDVVNDYSGLAELAGFTYHDIMNMERQKSPTTELLEKWTGRNGTVSNLWKYLVLLGRFDMLADCRSSILQDCRSYAGDFEIYRRWNDRNGEREDETCYDAFISWSYDEGDRQSLYQLIDELEGKRGLTLFVPGRDDVPDHTVTAHFINQRCRRVVVLMSRKFFQSTACDFQVKFAHGLAPGERNKKIIQIIREKNTPIPRILRSVELIDFTRSDIVEWAWDRLHSAVTEPKGQEPSNPFDMSDESLKRITFPTPRHLDEIPGR